MLTHICSGKCYKCTKQRHGENWKEKNVPLETRSFHLVRALFRSTPKKTGVIIDCWECQQCKELVPAETWSEYQKTGNIVVKSAQKPKRGR